jgi:hypothetical protein
MIVVAWSMITNTVTADELYELLSPFPLSNVSISSHFVPMHIIPYHMLDN